jgi:uracil-DNA glycosylase
MTLNPQTTPITYELGSNTHPIIKFSRQCKACELFKSCLVEDKTREEGETGYRSFKDRKYKLVGGVGGAGPDDLTEVKLIVISDYPGAYELESSYPFYSNDEEIKPKLNRRTGFKSLEGYRNAGNLIRYYLNTMYGLNTYTDVWFTNAIKCSPGAMKAQDKHLRVCITSWLKNELAVLSQHIPTSVPILILGNMAFKALGFMKADNIPKTLQEGRRSTGYTFGGHPLIFSVNPTAVARNEMRIESITARDSQGSTIVRKVVPTIRQGIGTPYWFFEKDLLLLQPYLGEANLINVRPNELNLGSNED